MGWLIDPYVDAYLRLHPQDTRSARQLLEGLTATSTHRLRGWLRTA